MKRNKGKRNEEKHRKGNTSEQERMKEMRRGRIEIEVKSRPKGITETSEERERRGEGGRDEEKRDDKKIDRAEQPTKAKADRDRGRGKLATAI